VLPTFPVHGAYFFPFLPPFLAFVLLVLLNYFYSGTGFFRFRLNLLYFGWGYYQHHPSVGFALSLFPSSFPPCCCYLSPRFSAPPTLLVSVYQNTTSPPLLGFPPFACSLFYFPSPLPLPRLRTYLDPRERTLLRLDSIRNPVLSSRLHAHRTKSA